MQKCIVICGQTGTGKSDLAVNIALALKKRGLDAEIISADSRQVYNGFDKTSAKITSKEMHGIKHHMLSIANPKKDYTVAEFKKTGTKIIKDILKRNSVPIICGGTGLYIDNLVYKKTIPEVAPNPKLRVKLERLSLVQLQNLLIKKDPKRANNIDLKNPRRIIRALEIIEELGYVPESIEPELLYNTFFIGLTLPKKELEKKIVSRTNKRMRMGMVKEMKDLHEKQKLSYERLQSFGMEYKWLSMYLRGNITKAECIDGINRDTMAYAKRQMTWFKKNKDIHWFSTVNKTQAFKEAKVLICDFLK